MSAPVRLKWGLLTNALGHFLAVVTPINCIVCLFPRVIGDLFGVVIVLSVLGVKSRHDDLEFENVIDHESVSFVRTLWCWNVVFVSFRGDGDLKLRFVFVAFVPFDVVLFDVDWFRFFTYDSLALVPSISLP